jgi:hypothetical protein
MGWMKLSYKDAEHDVHGDQSGKNEESLIAPDGLIG